MNGARGEAPVTLSVAHGDPRTSCKVQELDVGDRILLCETAASGQPDLAWAGLVQGRTPEGLIAVLTGRSASTCPVKDGQPVYVEYWKDYGRQVFTTRVLRRLPGKRPRLLLAEPPIQRIRRSPRRSDYRIGTALAAVLHHEGEDNPCLVTDLSAGGCRVSLRGPAAVGEVVALSFTLPGAKEEDEGCRVSRQVAEVRRVRALKGGRRGRDPQARGRPNPPTCAVGLRFRQLDSRTENALMRYVAFRQRELIQQGVLH